MNIHTYIVCVCVCVLGNDKFILYYKFLAKTKKCLKVTIQVRAAAGAGQGKGDGQPLGHCFSKSGSQTTYTKIS